MFSLATELLGIHDVFHFSMLLQYRSDRERNLKKSAEMGELKVPSLMITNTLSVTQNLLVEQES